MTARRLLDGEKLCPDCDGLGDRVVMVGPEQRPVQCATCLGFGTVVAATGTR